MKVWKVKNDIHYENGRAERTKLKRRTAYIFSNF